MNDLYTFDLLILLSGRASNLINHSLAATLDSTFFHLPANFSSKISGVVIHSKIRSVFFYFLYTGMKKEDDEEFKLELIVRRTLIIFSIT